MTRKKVPESNQPIPKAAYPSNIVMKKTLSEIEKQARSELKKNETEANNLQEKRKNLLKKLEEIDQNLEKITQNRKKITRETREKIVQFARENY